MDIPTQTCNLVEIIRELFRMKDSYTKNLSDVFPNSERAWKISTYKLHKDVSELRAKDKTTVMCTVCEAVSETTSENLMKGRKPCKCGNNYYNTPEKREERVSEVSKIKGIYRLTDEPILNANQKFLVECSKCFYSWEVFNYSYFCNTDRGCPCCAKQQRYSDGEYEERINQVGLINKFRFHSKLNNAKLRQHSRVNLRCMTCEYIWDSILSNTLSGKYSCPNCARRGFNPFRSSHLYLLKIGTPSGSVFYKYGISNNIKKRLENIKAASPDSLINLAATWFFEDGGFCRDVESLIKNKFTSYATKDTLPDGYTETVGEEFLGDLFEYIQYAYSTYIEIGSHSGVERGGSNTDPFGG